MSAAARRSGRLLIRVAVRSAAVAAIVLVVGVLAARASISEGQLRATRVLAASQSENILAETAADARLGGDFGSLPYELVGSNGVVVSSSTVLKDLEAEGPVMPVPGATAEQYVDASYPVPAPLGRVPALAGTEVAAGSTLRASGVSASTTADRPGGVPADGSYRVYVFVTPAAAQAALSDFDRFVWPGVLLAVLLVAAASASAVRSSLRTVEGMRAQAAAVDGSIRGGAIEVPAHDRELGELATTLNGMVGRLQAARETQRRFATDAAHELRSPIGSMVAALEIAAHYPDVIDARASLHHALQQARTVQHLATDLLASAGADSEAPRVTEVAVDELVTAATPPLRAGLAFERDLEPADVLVDSQRIARAVSNVLRNAARHAVHRIVVTGRSDGSVYRLRVVNDGEPVPEAETERIFEPFARLDEARGRDAGGAGLGLAIARRDVEASGGTLDAVAETHGMRFEFVLPSAR